MPAGTYPELPLEVPGTIIELPLEVPGTMPEVPLEVPGTIPEVSLEVPGTIPKVPLEVPGTMPEVPLELLWMVLVSTLHQFRVRLGCMVSVEHEFEAHFHPDIQQTLANQFLCYIVVTLGLFA